MTEFQDKLDRGEVTAKEFFDAWDREMEENEWLHPGFHERWHLRLKDKYPGPGISADEFFENPDSFD